MLQDEQQRLPSSQVGNPEIVLGRALLSSLLGELWVLLLMFVCAALIFALIGIGSWASQALY